MLYFKTSNISKAASICFQSWLYRIQQFWMLGDGDTCRSWTSGLPNSVLSRALLWTVHSLDNPAPNLLQTVHIHAVLVTCWVSLVFMHSSFSRMEDPPLLPCLLKFLGHSTHQFIKMLNMKSGNNRSEVRSSVWDQHPGGVRAFFYVYLAYDFIYFTDQQRQDFSIAAGMQYSVGDKCQVSGIDFNNATSPMLLSHNLLPFSWQEL